ncbi:MAG: dinitrogenase iron-molybdenum cofactor [Propionibacteriaceae bacterium]|jgi:predicted Fe-Mo cluster-binding NifX family protein|nr:dinitrogenase iron-molybdenum cofactor [Propionibacteriaceae bacterium]
MTTFAIHVRGDQVGGGWGRAHTVAIAQTEAGQITSWTEHEVCWDVLHGEGSHGAHHARVVRFLRENRVDVVISGHMGAPMERTLRGLGIASVTGAEGSARAIVASLAV